MFSRNSASQPMTFDSPKHIVLNFKRDVYHPACSYGDVLMQLLLHDQCNNHLAGFMQNFSKKLIFDGSRFRGSDSISLQNGCPQQGMNCHILPASEVVLQP